MQLWTVEEAAEALQVSVRTVGTLVAEGLLKPVKVEVVPHRRGATRRSMYRPGEVRKAYARHEAAKVRKRRSPHKRTRKVG